MKRGIVPSIAVVLVLVLVGWWTREYWAPGEIKRVRTALEGLAEDVSFGPNEGNIAAVRRISAAVDRFTPDCSIEVEILGVGTIQINGRDELQQGLMAAHREARRITLRFFDPVIELDAEAQKAHVHLTATAEAEGRRRNQDGFEAIEFEFNLRRDEGRWRVQSVRTVPTLRQ